MLTIVHNSDKKKPGMAGFAFALFMSMVAVYLVGLLSGKYSLYGDW